MHFNNFFKKHLEANRIGLFTSGCPRSLRNGNTVPFENWSSSPYSPCLEGGRDGDGGRLFLGHLKKQENP